MPNSARVLLSVCLLVCAVLVTAGTALAQDPLELVKEGRKLEQAGQLEEGLALYRKAVAANPKLFDAQLALGRALDLAGDLPGGRRALQEALSVADDANNDADVRRVVDQLDLRELASADVRTLSGGERQRVAVATALLQGAPLLLLDEPASHLDLAHQQLLVELLRSHADGGGAVVASLHDLNLAWDLASHAVLLDGRGGVCAGAKEVVMTPVRLAAAFGVGVDQVEVCGRRRFWVGPPALRDEERP